MNLQTTTQGNQSSLLQRSLQADAVAVGLSGLVFLLAAQPVASFLGLDGSPVLIVLGVIFVLYGAGLLLATGRESIRRQTGMAVVAVNVVWVIASVVLLLTGWVPLTTAGKWAVAVVADIVAIFAVVQVYALRKSQKEG